MHRLEQASFLIGLLSVVCAVPTLAAVFDRYPPEGRIDYGTLDDLIVVPLFYPIVRCAERQMR